MELLEYQAKELFRMVDIPILPSQTIKDSRKIKQLQIPYPVVLKSQVKSGGRGKAGGVSFVANTIDAIAAARRIFNLSILGEYPEVILAEAHYNTEREFFLAIVLDYDLQCPVLLGSSFGGMNVDLLLSNLQQVVVDTEFSLFYARRLAASMGLSGNLICSVSQIIAKMYRLFREQDLDLIEINPLGVNTKGELMALDGKITINDHALARQPILETLSFSESQKKVIQHNSLKQNKDLSEISWRWLDWHNLTGKIAIICNSDDLALLTWDLLKQNKVSPACGVVIENNFVEESNTSQPYNEQLLQIFAELKSIKRIKSILVNIWETETISREIVQTISSYCKSTSQSNSPTMEEQILINNSVQSNHNNLGNSRKSLESKPKSLSQPQFILRLLDQGNLEDMQMTETIYLSKSLSKAIQKAIAIVKSS